MATPPGDPRPVRRPARRPRYTGPPSYPAVPRWGFPLLAWRWPLALPLRPQADATVRAESSGATAVTALWITTGVAGLAAVAEVWRYLLLLRSRDEALSRVVLTVSDALVGTTGLLTWLLGAVSAVIVLVWALRTRVAANERVGVTSARPDWQVVVGTLVPGLNLVVPGAALAELEHTVLVGEGARAPGTRPSPSLLVRFWWAAWATTLLLGWLSFAWAFRTSVQAMADGVLLHAVNNAAVVVLALLTLRLIKEITALVAPVDPTELRRLRVLDVHGAPRPTKAPRPQDTPR
ncbi:DUF4328 domain-containing protein [Saccharopolyspora cebuensis]|uniref:DUF4328 domain-containing protein n=1 Tax=Saccharopolyspora cebuensis TaxID=418759 RepID=A0ABV4CNC2_9PSEU